MNQQRFMGIILIIMGFALLSNFHYNLKWSKDDSDMGMNPKLIRPLLGGIMATLGGIYMLIVG